MRDLAILFADLDDIVQKLSGMSNEEWAKDSSEEMKTYRRLMRELAQALKEKRKSE